jgi:Uma2 family endonuclease
MTTATLVPLEEYLHTSYEPDSDWIDGELRERPVGEGSHATIQTFFIKFFAVHEREWGIRVTQELRTQVAATRFRVPDVLLIRSDGPFEYIVRTPPLLCIEVLSPDDRMGEMQEKIDDYLAMGVTAVWIVNPRLRRAYMAESGKILQVAELTVPGTPIWITVPEVFAELDALESLGR